MDLSWKDGRPQCKIKSLPPRGGSGFKQRMIANGKRRKKGLPPRGGSGFKHIKPEGFVRIDRSPSARREWI